MRSFLFGLTLLVSGLAASATQCIDATPTPVSVWETIYKDLSSEELGVNRSDLSGNLIVGVRMQEKQVGGNVICQKTSALVPNPVFSYKCFITFNSNVTDQTRYESLNSGETLLTFSRGGSPVVGASTVEKSEGKFLCRKVTTISPDASAKYTCYHELELN